MGVLRILMPLETLEENVAADCKGALRVHLGMTADFERDHQVESRGLLIRNSPLWLAAVASKLALNYC